MNRNRTSQALVASPVLVGAVTLLVVIVGVFLAYNANSGLPFVPTYTLKAELPTRGQAGEGQRGAARRLPRGRGVARSRAPCAARAGAGGRSPWSR